MKKVHQKGPLGKIKWITKFCNWLRILDVYGLWPLNAILIASSFISLAFSFIPLSAYQVIVLKVADGVKELPDNYDSKLKAVSDAKKENVNFYIAAEIENDPLLSKPQKFTVGDGHKTKEFVNEELEKGENYIVYERALTKAEKVCKLLI